MSPTNTPLSPSPDQHEEPIPLGSRITHKFQEPIMLLVALRDTVKGTAVPPPIDTSFDIHDDKQAFEAFVNKLSHVCDSSKGGDTVTSLMILAAQEEHGPLIYLVASNRRSEEQLKTVAAYVRELLRKVDDAPENVEDQEGVRKQLLADILKFNCPRMSVYLHDLQGQASECLSRYSADDSANDSLLVQELEAISSVSIPYDLIRIPKTEYLGTCDAFIRLLIRIYQSPAGKWITDRAMEGRMPGQRSVECWSDFLHTSMRILAYLQSVKFFLVAKERWSKLFQAPTVTFVPSSKPVPRPFRNKSLTADGIVGRMTRKEKQIEIFREFVKTLQAFDLDDRIKKEYGKESFNPIVHAEVLLLDWLQHHGGIDKSRFFNDFMYIGSSKPMCTLCYYYFTDHRSNVGHRPCHGNIYPSWRVPDVFPSQGETAIAARQIMVDRLLQRIRNDAFNIVRKKIPPVRKEEDSNTFSAALTLEDGWTINGPPAEIDDLTSLLGQMDMTEGHDSGGNGYNSDTEGGALL